MEILITKENGIFNDLEILIAEECGVFDDLNENKKEREEENK